LQPRSLVIIFFQAAVAIVSEGKLVEGLFLKLGVPKKTCFILAALLATVSAARAGEIEDSQTIGLFSEEQPMVATSPIPRPISKIAENVTVITAEEILRLNAHTLAEVLQTVPGIQLDFAQRTPGTFTFFNIQGALNSTVLVLIDGIRQNDFDQDIALPGMIPVQQIERIEIVKGAASGSWGSALGGVINIVTKSPNPEVPLSGVVSQSIGSRFTADSRAELSGTHNSLGYYLTAGHLRSDGLAPHTSTSFDNLYGKLAYTLPDQGTLTAGFSQVADWSSEGEGQVPRRGLLLQDGLYRHSYGFLKFQQPFANKLNLDILGYGTGLDEHAKIGTRDPLGKTVYLRDFTLDNPTRGANASLSWGDSRNNVIAGGEYLHGHGRSRDLLSLAPPIYDRTWDSYAGYLNGTLSIGDLAILPGVRFDSTGFSGDHMSYTLGVTYQLTEKTTLRAYAAQGFSLAMLAFNTGTQKVRTAQGGIESGAVPFLWLKGTYFFNGLQNAESVGPIGSVTATDQNRQGFELEARTTPFLGITLSGGYTYLYAVDEESGKRLQTNGHQSVPPQVYKLALDYDNPALAFHGALTGSGVEWNASPGFVARSAGVIWDLNLKWKPPLQHALTPELFFSAHNLFDGVQTTNTLLCTTPSRWYEGGARFGF
jgi:vitamin B12 transporter